MLRRCFLFAGIFALVGVPACSDLSIPASRPTQIFLEVDQAQRPVGEDFTFSYEGEGENIIGLILSYGDGQVDSIPTFGAQTVGGRREHAFQEAGVFQVTIRMEEASGAVVEDALNVEALPLSGGSPPP